jgi:hypothetical protein
MLAAIRSGSPESFVRVAVGVKGSLFIGDFVFQAVTLDRFGDRHDARRYESRSKLLPGRQTLARMLGGVRDRHASFSTRNEGPKALVPHNWKTVFAS